MINYLNKNEIPIILKQTEELEISEKDLDSENCEKIKIAEKNSIIYVCF